MAATPGQLRERITIKKPTYVTKSTGQKVAGSWTTFLECNARLQSKGGTETVEATQVQASRVWTVTTRYFEGLSTKDRIEVAGGITLEVVNFGWDERRTRLEISCVEAD